MGKGTFTSSGHFIVLRGITEQGNVLIADPKNKKIHKKHFPWIAFVRSKRWCRWFRAILDNILRNKVK